MTEVQRRPVLATKEITREDSVAAVQHAKQRARCHYDEGFYIAPLLGRMQYSGPKWDVTGTRMSATRYSGLGM